MCFWNIVFSPQPTTQCYATEYATGRSTTSHTDDIRSRFVQGTCRQAGSVGNPAVPGGHVGPTSTVRLGEIPSVRPSLVEMCRSKLDRFQN